MPSRRSSSAVAVVANDELDPAILAAASRMEGVWRAADLLQALAPPYRVGPRRLLERLEALAAVPDGARGGARIFRYGARTKARFLGDDPEAKARAVLLDRLSAGVPIAPHALGGAVRAVLPDYAQRDVDRLLRALVDAGRCWKLAAKAYIGRDPAEVARDAALAALADGPATEKEIEARVAKALPGYRGARLRKLLVELAGHRAVLELPRRKRAPSRWVAAPPRDLAPFLEAVMKALDEVARALAPYGVGRDALLGALAPAGVPAAVDARAALGAHALDGPANGGARGVATSSGAPGPQREDAPAVTDDRMLSAILAVRPDARLRVFVSLRDLRRKLLVPKDVFDAAVLSFGARGHAVLHHHDHAPALDEAERGDLVTDGHGNFYAGLVLRAAR